jgi:hypothetical protein
MEATAMELVDGSGSGYGEYKAFVNLLLKPFEAPGVCVAFWRCTKDNQPANGGSGTIAKEGLIEEIEGPLAICTQRGLHGTLDPTMWKGEKWWIVQLHEPVQQEKDKRASLKRTFVRDLGICPFPSS